jgi:hypothetical protein
MITYNDLAMNIAFVQFHDEINEKKKYNDLAMNIAFIRLMV